MYIVETLEQQQDFLTKFAESDSIVIPILADPKLHPLNDNHLSLLYCKLLTSDKSYMLAIDHPDSVDYNTEWCAVIGLMGRDREDHKVYVYDKKSVYQSVGFRGAIDVCLLNGSRIDISDTDTSVHAFIHGKYGNFRDINKTIPLTKHYEKCEQIANKMQMVIDAREDVIQLDSFGRMNNDTIFALSWVEYSGICVNPDRLKQHFGINRLKHVNKNNLIYSQYNIYTATGRPSNRFGGINFAALNKDTGSRSAFISRFGKGGTLLSYDYDAYHLRLLAKLVGYEFPMDIAGHEYLGKQYFETDNLTPEQYVESKEKSYELLYGNITDEVKHIPFFAACTVFIDRTWKDFQQQGHIKSVLFDREIYLPKHVWKNKVLSYLLQSYETERNVLIIHQLMRLLRDTKTKLVLYTYDSFLFDFCIDDTKQLVIDIKSVLEDNEFPARVEYGIDYDNMNLFEVNR